MRPSRFNNRASHMDRGLVSLAACVVGVDLNGRHLRLGDMVGTCLRYLFRIHHEVFEM